MFAWRVSSSRADFGMEKHYHYDGDGLLLKIEAWKEGVYKGLVPITD